MGSYLDGKFIVLDGPDGCGKSTQTRMLIDWASGKGAQVISARDPGGTRIGEKIRAILLDNDHHNMGDNVEVMLYMASRGQLWKETIGPAIEGGKCVILDRWLSSTCAYQGYAGGVGIDTVMKVAGDCLERVWPDVTIILDVDLETAAGRMNRELDRMESKPREYHERVREGFVEFAKEGQRVFVVDARADVEAVHREIVGIAEKCLGVSG